MPKLKILYFRIHNVNDANKPQSALPFAENRHPTEYASKVYENLYAVTENKEELLRKIENGELCYSIIEGTVNHIPDQAFVLKTFSQKQSEQIKTESWRILKTIQLKEFFAAMILLAERTWSNPSSLFTFIFLLSLPAFAVAQNFPYQNPGKNKNASGKKDNNLDSISFHKIPELNRHKTIAVPYEISRKMNSEIVDLKTFPKFDTPQKLRQYAMEAMNQNDMAAFEHAVFMGFDPMAKDDIGLYLINHAARANAFHIIRYIATRIKGIDLNHFEVAAATDSLLSIALYNGHIELAEAMVTKWNFNANTKYEHGYTLAHVLAMTNSELFHQMLANLVSIKGVDINRVDPRGVTPLFCAADVGNIQAMKVLLAQKHCKTSILIEGRTRNILSSAIIYESPAAVRFLLENNFDPWLNTREYAEKHGAVPLDVPVLSAVLSTDSKTYLEIMQEYKVNLGEREEISAYLLMAAFVSRRPELAYYLVKRGVKTNNFKLVYSGLLRGQSVEVMADAQFFLEKVDDWHKYTREYKELSDYHKNYIKFLFNPDLEQAEIMEFVAAYDAYLTSNLPEIEKIFKHIYTSEKYVIDALREDNLPRFKQALALGYDIGKKNPEGKYTFVKAAEFNSLKILRFVIKMAETLKINLNQFQPENNKIAESMLLIAAFHNNMEIGMELVNNGFDTNHRSETGHTLLHYVASYQTKNTFNVFKRLVELGLDINARDMINNTPLFVASHSGQKDIMNYLLDKKNCETHIEMTATVNNIPFNVKSSILTMSITYNRLEAVDLLLKRNFDIYGDINQYHNNVQPHTIDIPILALSESGNLACLEIIRKNKISLNKYPQIAHLQLGGAFAHNHIDLAYALVRYGLQTDSFREKYHSMGFSNELIREIDEFFITLKKWKHYQKQHNRLTLEERNYIKEMTSPDIDNLSIPAFVEAYQNVVASQKWNEQKNQLLGAALFLISEPFMYYADPYIFRLLMFIFKMLGMSPFTKVPKKPDHPEIQEPEKSGIIDEVQTKAQEKMKELKNTLFSVRECLLLCEAEKDNIISTNDINKMTNRISGYLEYREEVLKDGYRDLQKQINIRIIELHKAARDFNSELKPHDAYIGNKGHTLIDTLHQELKLVKDNLENAIEELDHDAKQAEFIHITCDTEAYKQKFILFKQANNKIKNFCKINDNLSDEIAMLDKAVRLREKEKMEKERREREKQGSEKLINSVKETEHKISAETINTPSVQNNDIISRKSRTINNKQVSKPKKEKPRDNAMVKSVNMSLAMLDPDKIKKEIKNDIRVKYACQLFLTVQNIVLDHNVDNEYKQDASLYLLVKTAHLIASFSSEKYGYGDSIMIELKNRLYHIRNNIIHYPVHCLKSMDLEKFFSEYYKTFNERLCALHDHGYCETIKMDNLNKLSEFILTEHQSLVTAYTREMCLLDIRRICNKAGEYYKIGKKLHEEKKFFHSGPLHYALSAIFLQLRELFNRLEVVDKHLYFVIARDNKEIGVASVELIKSMGNQIAHKFGDDSRVNLTQLSYLDQGQFSDYDPNALDQQGRVYYFDQEEIQPFTLLAWMDGIAKLGRKIEHQHAKKDFEIIDKDVEKTCLIIAAHHFDEKSAFAPVPRDLVIGEIACMFFALPKKRPFQHHEPSFRKRF